MDVMLIYQCSNCYAERKSIVANVSVDDHLQLRQRMPDGWTVYKKGKETYLCTACTQKLPNHLTSKA